MKKVLFCTIFSESKMEEELFLTNIFFIFFSTKRQF